MVQRDAKVLAKSIDYLPYKAYRLKKLTIKTNTVFFLYSLFSTPYSLLSTFYSLLTIISLSASTYQSMYDEHLRHFSKYGQI